jgi:3-oxoacyl-[acyl-carrier protein] reductase
MFLGSRKGVITVEDNNSNNKLLPLLPLRGLTIFPYMVLHFDVGREKSIAALEEAMVKDQLIFLVTQKDAKVDSPTVDDIYKVGTVSKIKQLLKLPGDTIRVLVEGINRGEIIKITKEEDVLNLMNTVHRHWGAIDILVNNAGIVATKSIEELSLEEWNNTLSINLTGTFLCCKYALRFMKSRRYGKIINMGSLAGQSGGIMVGADYSASKGGIIAFTKTVAREAAPYNINVNVVSPGTISTGGIDSFHDEGLKSIKALIPLGRLGKVEDVAQLILFLVSEEADFITGATFDINGGLLMR